MGPHMAGSEGGNARGVLVASAEAEIFYGSFADSRTSYPTNSPEFSLTASQPRVFQPRL